MWLYAICHFHSINFIYWFPEFNGIVSRLVNTTNMNLDALKVDHTTWVQQFQNAMNVNGGDIETASGLDYFLHFLTFAWKVSQ
jgi:solute carrier family 8 (sodium/calcium exchanger)